MPAYIKCTGITKVFPFKGDSESEKIEHRRQFSDGKLTALENVGFELNEGDALGVIGLNGAGKSTLLKILSGVLKPNSGEAEISGTVTSILEQSSIFGPELTGIENLIFYGNMLGYKTSYIKSKIPKILGYADLEMFGNTQLKNYSSGMKLRLAFGLMKELSSDILILDEALSAGDQIFQEKIATTLDDYFAEQSILILATHDFKEIVRYCNKCLLLEFGKPVFLGDVHEAISVFYAQNRGTSEDGVQNDTVKLISANITNHLDEFMLGEPVQITIEYEILKAGIPIELMITLTDTNGPVLIDSLQFRDGYTVARREKGTYKDTIEVPGSLLNMGSYALSVMFGNSRNHIYLKSDRVVNFKITPDDKEINQDLSNAAISYPVRSPLAWKSQVIDRTA